jgi:hypothetical protein
MSVKSTNCVLFTQSTEEVWSKIKNFGDTTWSGIPKEIVEVSEDGKTRNTSIPNLGNIHEVKIICKTRFY